MATVLDCRELKQVIDLLFERLLQDPRFRAVEISDKDYFWEVPYDRLFAVTDAQPKLDVGRMSDDWEFLRAILNDNEQAVRPMLAHVVSLLRFLAEDDL